MTDSNLDLRTALVGDLVIDDAGRYGMICEVFPSYVNVTFDSCTYHFTGTYTYTGQPCGSAKVEPLVKHYTQNKGWPAPNYGTPAAEDADHRGKIQVLTVSGYWSHVQYSQYHNGNYVGWAHTRLWLPPSVKDTLIKRLNAALEKWQPASESNLLKDTIAYLENLKD